MTQSDKDDDQRLKNIRDEVARIKSADQAALKKQAAQEDNTESMSVGLRAGAELVTSIMAGGLIGYGLDHWLNTKPLFLIAFLIMLMPVIFINQCKILLFTR